MNPLRDLLGTVAKNLWFLLTAISTILTVIFIPSKWNRWIPLCCVVLVVLAAYKGIKNYANQIKKLQEAHTEELDRLRQEHSRELDRVRREFSTELRRALEEKDRLRNRIASLADNTSNAIKVNISNLISELEDDRQTAENYFTGSPGNHSYISPATDCWVAVRGQLSEVLDLGLMRELESAYAMILRWKGIVASSRTNPDIGNREVDRIAIIMRTTLSDLISKLKGIKEQLSIPPAAPSH